MVLLIAIMMKISSRDEVVDWDDFGNGSDDDG